MKKQECTIVMALMFMMLLMGISQARAESPELLLQQGIIAETGDRDFNKAVELYKQAIQLAGTSNRDLAAKAELQLGLCYEAMGKEADAVPAYHAVLNLLPDKSSDVTEAAQTHLQRLESRITATGNGDWVAAHTSKQIFTENPWEIALELGYLSLQENGTVTNGQYYLQNAVLWGDVSYRPTRHLSLGVEGGDMLPRYTNLATSNYTTNTYSHGYYVGAFAQARTEWERLPHFFGYFRIGLGELHLKQTVSVSDAFSNSYTDVDQSSFNTALAFTIGLDYEIFHHLSMGIGARDIIPVKNHFLAQSYPMPFGRIAVHY